MRVKKASLDALDRHRPHTFTKENAAEYGRKGGFASVKAMKEKRLLSEILMAKLAEKFGKGTNGEAVIDALIHAAQKGDVKSIKEIFDRTEGKAIQQVKVEGDVTVANALLAARKRITKADEDEEDED